MIQKQEWPSLSDVLAARTRIQNHVVRTPLHRHISLDKIIGGNVYVKHENHQKLGAFKIRGGINLLAQMDRSDLDAGVSTASSGNHGQSIAYAARLFNAKAHIAVPENTSPGKVESMINLGAEVIHHGPHFGASDEYIRKLSEEKGYFYIHPVEESRLYAGVGTYGLEIMEDLPDVDVIIVPVGGGSGVCGTSIVAKSIRPEVKIVGVQAEKAPAAYNSWKTGSITQSNVDTLAEGLATNSAYEPAQSIMKEMMDDFILVSDEEMEEAIVMHLQHTRNLMEHAGASTLAAALKIKNQLSGKNVVLVASGGNLSMQNLVRALDRYKD